MRDEVESGDDSSDMTLSTRDFRASKQPLDSPVTSDESPMRHMPGIPEYAAGSLNDLAYVSWHEMLENENGNLASRVQELEKKVIEQGDEIVCLRATLADALRRLNVLEGSKNVTTPIHQRNGNSTTSSSATSLHIKANFTPTLYNTNNNNNKIPRQQPIIYRNNVVSADVRDATSTHGPHGLTGPNGANGRRASAFLPSAQQRRAARYQSTGSLHSGDSQSSSSVSPSQSPRATPLPKQGQINQNLHMVKTPLAQSNSTTGNGATNGTSALSKRWSSIGDFHNVQGNGYNTNSSSSNSPVHSSTRDATYNEDDGTVRMFLRGRPIVLHAPIDQINTYDITKVATAPQARLKLDWVYGYRGKDCRSNLYLLPTGEIIYFVAAVVVLFNVEEQCQRHYLGHTDDVKCLAVHPNKLLVASGQCASHDKRESRPHIRIWNTVSLTTMTIIYGDFERSICCMSFSKADGGILLAAIDESNDHNISVWEWQKGEHGSKITETKCSVDTVVAAEFHPLDKNSIITCGKNNVSFWTLDHGGTLYKRMGIFEGRDKPKYVTCVAFNQMGDVLTGDSNGNIVVWGRGTNSILKMVKGVHEGSIFSICASKDSAIISGGGKDGRIVQFDNNLNRTGLEAQVELHFGGIRVLSEGRGSQLLVGTTRNCILTGAINLGFQPAILGHTDELWGLAAHPSLPQFATAGLDRLLQMWDSLSHTVIWSKDIGEQAQSVGFSNDGNVLVVGCLSGHWLVFDSQTRDLLGTHSDGSEPLQVVRFSPDGQFLAIGSRDNYIYLYQVADEGRKYSRIGRCMGHSSFITHIDWSLDSQFIRSNSGDYELLYWNASTCRQVPQSLQMRDVEWATNTCTLTFQTIGIWPEGADGTDVNYCDRSQDGKLLATADDFGKVRLYAYPASQPKTLHHTYDGHSSHVTSVSFLYDNTRLISIGGSDTSVLQWTISKGY